MGEVPLARLWQLPDGTSCLLSGATATGPVLTCEAATYGEVGASCDTNFTTAQCKNGLVCAAAGKCSPPPVSFGQAGRSCARDSNCAAGLGCGVRTHCAPVTWVGAGETCNNDDVRCLVGNCAYTGIWDGVSTVEGKCPKVLPDGEWVRNRSGHLVVTSTRSETQCLLVRRRVVGSEGRRVGRVVIGR